ncbi:MAG: DUF4339 domain-containing protein, partial [Verrucomicrobia bacterium]|nr:DUF4339 domain-containing protein [Verrucomicrobiota bacterium]
MELFVAHNGQQTGPFNETQLHEMLASGAIVGTDLAWHQGLSGWQPLNTLISVPGATTGAPMPAAAPPAYAPPAYTPPAGGPPQYMQPPAYAYPPGAGGMIDTSNLAGLGARL